MPVRPLIGVLLGLLVWACGQPCGEDGACRSGFCDRGRCAEPMSTYGRSCPDGVFPLSGPGASKLYVCGPYVCDVGRCRSCTSDEECMELLGAPRCVAIQGQPGQSCGDGRTL